MKDIDIYWIKWVGLKFVLVTWTKMVHSDTKKRMKLGQWTQINKWQLVTMTQNPLRLCCLNKLLYFSEFKISNHRIPYMSLWPVCLVSVFCKSMQIKNIFIFGIWEKCCHSSENQTKAIILLKMYIWIVKSENYSLHFDVNVYLRYMSRQVIYGQYSFNIHIVFVCRTGQ